MKTQKNVIKLTTADGKPILIGTESIIKVEEYKRNEFNKPPYPNSKITSREAMATTTHVIETIEEIYNLIENK